MAEVSPCRLAGRMIRLALTILGLVLQILVERGKTKGAREAAARYEDFKFFLEKGDTARAGVLCPGHGLVHPHFQLHEQSSHLGGDRHRLSDPELAPLAAQLKLTINDCAIHDVSKNFKG